MDPNQANRFIHDLLRLMISRNGTELLLIAGYPPAIRFDGALTKVSPQALTAQHTRELAQSLMTKDRAEVFARHLESSFFSTFEKFGRFRVNVFTERGQAAAILQRILSVVPTLDQIGLPPVLSDMAMRRHGLVVLAGLEDHDLHLAQAALVEHRNATAGSGHILIFDDPMVYDHANRNCVVTQRELGLDTDGTEKALDSARQLGADMIALGCVNSRSALERALATGRSGRLCLIRVRAADSLRALTQLSSYWPEDCRGSLMAALSSDLCCLIALRSLPGQQGGSRVLAAEVVINSKQVSEVLASDDLSELMSIVKRSRELGMQSFEQALFELYDRGWVAYEDALLTATSVNDLRLQIKLESNRARSADLAAGMENLAILGVASVPAASPLGWTSAPAATALDGQTSMPSPVLLGASAPMSCRPGAEFTARFVAYAAEFESQVSDMLRQLSPRSTTHRALKRCRWTLGTELSVRLDAAGLALETPVQQVQWPGDYLIVDFDVCVPPDLGTGIVVLKFDVSVASIVVARLRIDLDVREDDCEAGMASVRGEAARTAFASYSSVDRDRVLDRVATARICAGLDIFLDCLSLHPGEAWKARLEREILDRDLFLLFWSKQAAASEWVTWEWRTARERKSSGALQVHPLDNEAPPPDELSDLHFADALMQFRSHLSLADPSQRPL